MICPLCQFSNSDLLLALNLGNIDNSTLYPTIRLKSCCRCGHVFNDLTPAEMSGLNNYYNVEYAPANLNALDTKGGSSGKACALTNVRYGQLYDVLLPYIQQDHYILDIGCAWGGFLGHLKQRGHRHLFGVDMVKMYTQEAQKEDSYKIELGKAEALPFEDNIFDVVIIEQVLEHLENPLLAFQEAKRVLKSDGILCIGVPDAIRYNEFYFFDFFWLLREHIQHFDADHLQLLASGEGFETLEYQRTLQAINSEQMLMPNLYAIFRRSNSFNSESLQISNGFKLKEQMIKYIDQEQARQAAKIYQIKELAKSQRPVYVWGIGREFLYLYESAGLKQCNIINLMDKNQLKQREYSVDGINVIDPCDAMRQAPGDSVLVITAVAHTEAIEADARKLGFKGEILSWSSIVKIPL